MEIKVQNMEAQVQEARLHEIEKIVKGVAKKYGYGSKWVEQDDLEQELWVKVIDACGGDFTSLSLQEIARICWNRAVDLYRYNRLRYDHKASYEEEMFETKTNQDGTTIPTSSQSDEQGIVYSHFLSGNDLLFFKEVISLFEQGSKERKYVVLKLFNYGLLPKEMLSEEDLPDAIVLETEGGAEQYYMRAIGYSNGNVPGSWVGKKWKMREKIAKIL